MPVSKSYMAEEQPVRDEGDIPFWNGHYSANNKPTIGEQLDKEQCEELQKLLGEFADVFQNQD